MKPGTPPQFFLPALSPRIALLVVGLLCVVSQAMAERTVTLTWNPPSDGSAAGFYVYCHEEGADAPIRLDVGGVTRTSVSGLKEGLRYRFFVTTYNHARLESAPSNAATLEVPVPILLNRPASPTAIRRLRFPAAPGRAYVVEASPNLRDWSPIWQTGIATTYNWVEIPDLQSATLPQRFYRLRIVRPPATP
jgi:hypothetical protein